MEHGSWRRTNTGWGEVQQDLLQRIRKQLDPSTQWAMRHVSSHWRESSDCQQLVITALAERLSTKIAVLHAWRKDGKLRNSSFSFVVAVPVVLRDLASLLEGLTSQLDSLTTCSISVALVIAQSSAGAELAAFANCKQVATSAHLLQQHQLALRISVGPAKGTTIVPPPDVLRQLRAFLHEFDTYSIPTEQPAACRTTSTDLESKLSYDHVEYLLDSNLSKCTFSTSTQHEIEVPSSVKIGIVHIVAAMTHLTKLHLTIADQFYLSTIDFQPLSKLVLLTDLALQIVHKVPTCCNGVLTSNCQTLQFVTLTAGSWTAATYCSLQHIAQLKILNLTIMGIDTAQAQALMGVTAEVFRLTLHGDFSPQGIQALQNSQPKVHELTLRNSACNNFQTYLPELPSLQRLTLRECLELTGKSLPSYPRVTQLTLLDCHLITGPGMQHIIRTAFPALEVISFHVTPQIGVAIHMSVRSLNALHFGPNLQCIDLRGVCGLTSDRVTQFCNTLHGKQRRDKVQLCATLLLPACLDEAEAVFETPSASVGVLHTHYDILLPNLYKLPISPHINKVVIKK
ncbi:hypothetical protein ABBQ38_014874 [Trebouxia sp. C0009 RCD-2024]